MKDITDIRFSPISPGKIIVLEENEIARSEDNGQTWQHDVYPPYGDDVNTYYYGIKASYNPFKDDELLISSNYFPFSSTDGGATLAKVSNPFFSST
jgi:hypothetical protein